jgi:hypothetical protein
MDFSQHPLSAAFPSMGEDEFQALYDDIETQGQNEPIIIHDGMVLDGWNRYQVLKKAALPIKHKTFDGNDPVAFVQSQNLHRRHLTESQRAAAVVAVSAWRPAHREKKVATVATLSKTNEQMAKDAGVSVRTITDAKAAKRADLIDVVRDGGMTAKEAGKIARGTDMEKPEKKVEPSATFLKAVDSSEDDDAVAILSEENDRLNDRLAVVAMQATPEERAAAADTIGTLRTQVKTLTAELKAVKSSRDSYMLECGELKKQCAGYKRQIDKLKKG